MKFNNYKLTLLGVFLLGAIQAQANIVTDTQFAKPGKICFPQTSLYTSSDEELTNVMLDHYLIVDEEDHYKIGDVFMIFRLKGQDREWFYDGSQWRERIVDEANTYVDFLHHNSHLGTFELQPVIPTSISRYPINVSEFIGIGELWVGYGLRSEEETSLVSYNEMIQNGRFNLVWEIGNTGEGLGGLVNAPVSIPTICISMTEMTKIVTLIGHGPISVEEED